MCINTIITCFFLYIHSTTLFKFDLTEFYNLELVKTFPKPVWFYVQQMILYAHRDKVTFDKYVMFCLIQDRKSNSLPIIEFSFLSFENQRQHILYPQTVRT